MKGKYVIAYKVDDHLTLLRSLEPVKLGEDNNKFLWPDFEEDVNSAIEFTDMKDIHEALMNAYELMMKAQGKGLDEEGELMVIHLDTLITKKVIIS